MNQVSFATTDHKAEESSERARVESRGGRVFASKGSSFPLRVWLKKENKPGLAMTRSMGDFECSSIGIISIPTIYKY